MAASWEGHAGGDEIVLSLCAGSSLVKEQIIFSSDSRFLFCCSGSVVKVYNTTNGQCAQQLRGHKDAVTGLALNPVNKLQLFSCGLDGVINQWDFSDGVLLKSHTFFMPLHGIVSIDSSASSASVIALRPQTSNCCVVRLPLKKKKQGKQDKSLHTDTKSPSSKDQEEKGATDPPKTDILITPATGDHRLVSEGCNGEYIVSVNGYTLTVYSYKKRTSKQLMTDKLNPFTCVACHPVECCLAAGHKNGKISMWWNFFDKDKMVMAGSHWHSLPVESLCFTPQGSHLLSGGHECVLVKWQLNADSKDFLPRLGAPIQSVASSPDGTMYVTSHKDNVLHLISNWKVQLAIRGLARAHLGTDSKVVKPLPVGLLCDPRSGALVTNGRPGHLQFYCMSTDTQLFNLDIVGQNYISPENLKTPPTVTEVEQAAFDKTGDWLATFECWDDGQMSPEYRIKFWSFNRKTQNYQLNTTVESPHKKPISCLRFRPPSSASQTPTMVSSSSDGFFKIWVLVSETHINKHVERWTCDSVGYFRDRPAGTARFSEDGSLLAVTFQKTLTLWDPDTMIMKTALVTPACTEDIKFMEFGGKTCSHFIVTATAKELTIWNLISLSVHVKMAVKTAVMVTDGDLMAVVTTSQDLLVFRPNQKEPLFKKESMLKKQVTAAVLLPNSVYGHCQSAGEPLDWQQQSRLYLLDNRQQLYTPEYLDDVMSEELNTTNTKMALRQTLPNTPFSGILGGRKIHSKAAQGNSSRLPGTVWHQGHSAILDAMNPPVQPFHLICGQFIESLLLKNKSSEEPMEEGKESEDEDDDEEHSTMSDSS